MNSYTHRVVGLFLGVTAWALLWPSASGATGPVERLRRALMIEIGTTAPIFPNLELRKTEAKTAIDDMKSISQFRRAYFLSQWTSLARPEYIDKKVMPRVLEYDDQIKAERERIGAKLTDAIRQASQNPESDRQIAVAILIAELADGEQPTERRPAGKFASRFTDITLRLLKNDDMLVRQAGLNALGKITPKPAEALAPIKDALRSSDLGPRRLAAYALSDLVKNAHYRGTPLKNQLAERADEMETLAQAVDTAQFGLRSDEKDEQVRGYCLQAIAASAKAVKDYGWSGESPIQLQLDDKKLVLREDTKKILLAFQQTNSVLVAAATEENLRIQLTAFQTLEQIGGVRIRVLERLRDVEMPQGEQNKLLAKHDPFAPIVTGDWMKIAMHLDRTSREQDQQLRRRTIDFLESISNDIEQVLAKEQGSSERRRSFVQRMTPALADPDRYLRWSAIRALRNVAPSIVEKDVIVALGGILVEVQETDPDLTQAAASALEVLSDSDSAGASLPYLRSLIVNPQKDVESRLAGMQALVALAAIKKHEVTANAGFPAVVSTLTDVDVRVRRAAAATLGRLGRPATRELADEAITALRAALRDDDAEVRLNASEAILNIRVPGR